MTSLGVIVGGEGIRSWVLGKSDSRSQHVNKLLGLGCIGSRSLSMVFSYSSLSLECE